MFKKIKNVNRVRYIRKPFFKIARQNEWMQEKLDLQKAYCKCDEIQ